MNRDLNRFVRKMRVRMLASHMTILFSRVEISFLLLNALISKFPSSRKRWIGLILILLLNDMRNVRMRFWNQCCMLLYIEIGCQM